MCIEALLNVSHTSESQYFIFRNKVYKAAAHLNCPSAINNSGPFGSGTSVYHYSLFFPSPNTKIQLPAAPQRPRMFKLADSSIHKWLSFQVKYYWFLLPVITQANESSGILSSGSSDQEKSTTLHDIQSYTEISVHFGSFLSKRHVAV